jgi:hypothetical protein
MRWAGRGERGRGRESGCKSVVGRVGSDAFLLVRLPSLASARARPFTSPKYILHFKYATDILSHLSLPSVSPTAGVSVIVF